MSNEFPSFYVPGADASPVELYKRIADDVETLDACQIKARVSLRGSLPLTPKVIDGIPGIPFERGTPGPDVFLSGDTIVYDLFLIADGIKITPTAFDLTARVKTSPRSNVIAYEASLDNGLYYSNAPGIFELWLPSEVTQDLLAGSYHIQLQLIESVGTGAGKRDRKLTLLQHYFNIEYGNYSTTVEATNGTVTRSDAAPTWPNTPSITNKTLTS